MLRTFLLPALAVVLLGSVLLAGCSHTEAASPSASMGTSAARSAQDPLVAWESVRVVLQSARCLNCHPPGDAPLQGEESRVHDQWVQRGPDGHGLPGEQCSTCHGKANLPDSYGPKQPPGVSTDWHLPPPDMKMVFVGLSSRALCEQLKDPARNGHKDLAGLLKHVSTDPLVLWGWTPGFGRKPVSTPHADFVAAVQRWTAAGAPCPTATAASR